MKKNKWKLLPLLLVLLLIAGLTSGCSGESAAFDRVTEVFTKSSNTSGGQGVMPMPAAAPDYAPQGGADYYYENPEESSAAFFPGKTGGSSQGDPQAQADTFDKIIYSGSANVETIRFDETVQHVYELISQYGGFLESSYITGKDYNTTYYKRPSYRNASFVIRVPRENFQAFTGSLDSLGNVTNSSVYAQNITSSYMDTQSRLNTYRTEEERLLDMLSKADTVEDMLNIEDRLADVRYNIESLTTMLTNWDSKVNYSTLELNINEVKELTQETPITHTFWEDLWSGFASTCRWLGNAAKDIAIWLVSAVPVLILIAVVLAVVIIIIRSKRQKKTKGKDVNSAR